jgi:hypothetical protein
MSWNDLLSHARHFEHGAVRVHAVVAGRDAELLLERLHVALGLGDRVLQLPVEVDAAVHVLIELGSALLGHRDPVQRLGDLHLLVHAEGLHLLEERDVVRPRRDGHQDVRLGRLDLRQVRGELRAAERIGRRAENRAAELLVRLREHHVVLLAPRVVGVDDPPLLAEILHDPLADHARSDGRVQRLVERDGARVGLRADLVRLARRDEEDFGLLRLLVDRHLHVRGEAAHDELAAFLLDELLRSLRADLRLELIVAHEQLHLAAQDAALGVQLVHGELRALLHVAGDRGERACQR